MRFLKSQFIWTLCSVLWIYSCSSEKSISIQCQKGSACSAFSDGQEVQIQFSDIKEGEQYILAYLSRAPVTDTRNLRHILEIDSSQASSVVSVEEEKMRSKISAQKRFPKNIATNLESVISPPKANFFQENRSFEAYIPRLRDYFTQIPSGNGQTVAITVPIPTNPDLSGRKSIFESLESLVGETSGYRLFLNTQDFKSPNQMDPAKRLQLENYATCLKRLFPKTAEVIGGPVVDMDDTPGMKILLTLFAGDTQSRTLGVFSSMDRFYSRDGAPLKDSNRGEIIYVDPSASASRACSTTIHEYQHFINFEYKGIKRLLNQQSGQGYQFDISTMDQREFSGEELGLNEGYSHLFEEMTGEQQEVSDHIARFLRSPNETTFALEAAFNQISSNSQSRGLNTLFLHYVIRRAGGTIDIEDPTTRQLLRTLIQSEKTGFENIAAYFGISVEELLSDFLTHLAKASFDGRLSADLMPTSHIKGSYTSSVTILNRDQVPDSGSLLSQQIHPLEISIPLLTRQEIKTVPSQSIMLYRFIAPKGASSTLDLRLRSDDRPFAAVWVAL